MYRPKCRDGLNELRDWVILEAQHIHRQMLHNECGLNAAGVASSAFGERCCHSGRARNSKRMFNLDSRSAALPASGGKAQSANTPGRTLA